MPTIYIGGESELFLKDYSNMEILDDFNMNDVHPNLSMKIKSNGNNIETNFKVKKNDNKNKKIINNNVSHKIIKKKNISLEEKRAKNKIASQKCRKKKQLKLEETLKLVTTLKKELEEANEKINQLKEIINK
tara:strand:- start:10923 stop:11318 length:396 start_codon:yes stop_codon:yes gene_type:complete